MRPLKHNDPRYSLVDQIKRREEGAKRAHHRWGVAGFVHRLTNIKAFMRRLANRDSIEYDIENMHFSMLSFEKHLHNMREKWQILEKRLKETGRVNYTICRKCGGSEEKK